ncbi:vacuolar sorting protein, putative, partial [Perkinsus marinus ATCC 50983]
LRYTYRSFAQAVDQVVSCQDTMAQQYLLDCIIQVFPDEYHLSTLDSLLTTCSKTNSAVDLKPIIVNLMNRLAVYVSSNPGSVPHDLDVFELFRSHLDRMLDRRSRSSLASLIDIMGAYLGFTITLYPDRQDHLQVLWGTGNHFLLLVMVLVTGPLVVVLVTGPLVVLLVTGPL